MRLLVLLFALALPSCLAVAPSDDDVADDDDATGGPDPDSDGLNNADEADLGTDPNDPDTDSDGFEDGAEVNGESNPLDPYSWLYESGSWPGFADEATAGGVSGTQWTLGQVAQDFSGEDQYGNTVSLYDFYGHVIALVIHAAWSPPDVALADTAQTFWEAQRGNGFVVIHYLVQDDQSNDPLGYQSTWSEDRGFGGPVLVESSLSALEEMYSTGLFTGAFPLTLLLSRDLVVVSSAEGAPADGMEYFTEEVEGLLGDPAPF